MIVFSEQGESLINPAPENMFTAKRILTASLLVAFAFLYYFFASPPRGFPNGKIISIKEGASAGDAATVFAEQNVVRSPLILRTILTLSGQSDSIDAGDYLMSEPISVFEAARRLALGEFDLTPLKITVPEGSASFEIAELFDKNFYNFDKTTFITLASAKEGYLFPDTYLFLPNVTAEAAVRAMTNNFNRKIDRYRNDINESGKTMSQIITMASIVEREAGKSKDMAIVSGILWKRLEIHMPLQVDAPFAYISDKSTYELTTKDLKQSSPYNTYNRQGLPPGPIGNPGTDAMFAAIHPAMSPYLYYLSDKKGNIYYATTFDVHKKNKELYLNKK